MSAHNEFMFGQLTPSQHKKIFEITFHSVLRTVDLVLQWTAEEWHWAVIREQPSNSSLSSSRRPPPCVEMEGSLGTVTTRARH